MAATNELRESWSSTLQSLVSDPTPENFVYTFAGDLGFCKAGVPPTNTVSTPDVVDDSVSAFWDYQFLFVSQRSETTEPVTLRVVEGAVPPEFPSGTNYLTGPGLFSDNHGFTVHPLDSHGYLRAFRFDENNGDEVKAGSVLNIGFQGKTEWLMVVQSSRGKFITRLE